jgi:hypothetical protein
MMAAQTRNACVQLGAETFEQSAAAGGSMGSRSGITGHGCAA